MESTLVVSSTDKSAVFFYENLKAAGINQICVLNSAAEARRILLEQDFDLVVVDSPLSDESGENFSRYIIANTLSQVIFAVMSEHYNAIAPVCEEEGVLAISKPLNRENFLTSLSFAKSVSSRIRSIQAEIIKLKQKIDDIKIIDRAKLLLISYLNLSEQEAHRFIEKQAMDLRSSKRSIAEGILKTYAS